MQLVTHVWTPHMGSQTPLEAWPCHGHVCRRCKTWCMSLQDMAGLWHGTSDPHMPPGKWMRVHQHVPQGAHGPPLMGERWWGVSLEGWAALPCMTAMHLPCTFQPLGGEHGRWFLDVRKIKWGVKDHVPRCWGHWTPSCIFLCTQKALVKHSGWKFDQGPGRSRWCKGSIGGVLSRLVLLVNKKSTKKANYSYSKSIHTTLRAFLGPLSPLLSNQEGGLRPPTPLGPLWGPSPRNWTPETPLTVLDLGVHQAWDACGALP